MRVNLFNRWFKYKVPIDDHYKVILHHLLKNQQGTWNLWDWLNTRHDVGQYYNWKEKRNYLVFHNEHHYLTFLLKL